MSVEYDNYGVPKTRTQQPVVPQQPLASQDKSTGLGALSATAACVFGSAALSFAASELKVDQLRDVLSNPQLEVFARLDERYKATPILQNIEVLKTWLNDRNDPLTLTIKEKSGKHTYTLTLGSWIVRRALSNPIQPSTRPQDSFAQIAKLCGSDDKEIEAKRAVMNAASRAPSSITLERCQVQRVETPAKKSR